MRATNTGSHALIGFSKDYNEKEPWPRRTYQMTRAGGFCSNKTVGIAHRESVEFLLVETFEQLEIIRRQGESRRRQRNGRSDTGRPCCNTSAREGRMGRCRALGGARRADGTGQKRRGDQGEDGGR